MRRQKPWGEGGEEGKAALSKNHNGLVQISTLKKRKECNMVWNIFLLSSCKSLSCCKQPSLLKEDKTNQGMIWVKCMGKPCLWHALASCHRLFPVLQLGGEGMLPSLCLHLFSFWFLHLPFLPGCPRGLALCSRGLGESLLLPSVAPPPSSAAQAVTCFWR